MAYRQQHIQPKIRDINRKSFILRPGFWLLLVFFAFAGTSLYFMLFSPRFQLAQIKVAGYAGLDNQSIENIVWSKSESNFDMIMMSIPSRSIFAANLQEIAQEIEDSFPAVQKVNIQKEMPNIISLTIEERKPVATLCSNEGCFLVDKYGVIFEKVESPVDGQIALRKDGNHLYLGKTITSEGTMAMIVKIRDILQNNFQIGIKDVSLASPMIVQTTEGWKAYVDPARNSELQIAELNSLLESEITPNERKSLEYIYLQYKDRAYYK